MEQIAFAKSPAYCSSQLKQGTSISSSLLKQLLCLFHSLYNRHFEGTAFFTSAAPDTVTGISVCSSCPEFPFQISPDFPSD